MSTICSERSSCSSIGPVTISGTQMNTWHDTDQAILRLVKIAPTRANPKIMAYALQECNQSTIKSAAEFESLIEKNLIYTFTKEGELCSFLNESIKEEIQTSPQIYGLMKGPNTSILKPKVAIRLTNPENILDAKAQLKKISYLFNKGVSVS
jgi:hypothetical protein